MKSEIGEAGKIIGQLVWVLVGQRVAQMNVYSNSWCFFDLVKHVKSGYLLTFKKYNP